MKLLFLLKPFFANHKSKALKLNRNKTKQHSPLKSRLEIDPTRPKSVCVLFPAVNFDTQNIAQLIPVVYANEPAQTTKEEERASSSTARNSRSRAYRCVTNWSG